MNAPVSTDPRVSDEAVRQQLAYWREKSARDRTQFDEQVAACLYELQEWRRVAGQALGAIAGGDIYPQKLAREALDLMGPTVMTALDVSGGQK